MALKQAVAEVVGVRDMYGDIDVLPEDVTIGRTLPLGSTTGN